MFSQWPTQPKLIDLYRESFVLWLETLEDKSLAIKQLASIDRARDSDTKLWYGSTLGENYLTENR